MLTTAFVAEFLREFAATGYRFTAVTPLTHQRVLSQRLGHTASTLRDIFGWNLPFRTAPFSDALRDGLFNAGLLRRADSMWRSNCRISSIDGDLFLHSGYPTAEADAIFFGPDTYRFARFLRSAVRRIDTTAGRYGPVRVLDIGCGTGAGGIVIARVLEAAGMAVAITMNDINPIALEYTAANAEAAGIDITLAEGDSLSAVAGEFDVIVCNPPYLFDDAQRAYRHGGSRLGRALGVRIVQEALGRLSPGGQLLLYTGVAMVDGTDPFLDEVEPMLEESRCTWTYEEIDPDVFGEELKRPAYAGVDRIAAVGLVARRAPVPFAWRG